MDCETNRLIKQRGLNPTQTNLNMFPRIVQFSWGLYTEDGECKEVKNFIIEPDGWTMNGSDKYHGITQERAFIEGVDIKDVLTKYKDDIENHCCKLVCHNVDFDKRVVQSEFIRAKLELAEIETCCTMKKGINYCKLLPKVRGEYKWPSLEQLYRKCFNEDLKNAHNSYYDVINCAKCYFKMNGDEQKQQHSSIRKEAEEESLAEFERYVRKTGLTKEESRKEEHMITEYAGILCKRQLNDTAKICEPMV